MGIFEKSNETFKILKSIFFYFPSSSSFSFLPLPFPFSKHDILWDDLTVKEHLLFYARLKGVSSKDENAAAEESMRQVSLTPFSGRLSKGLSGGEKRRLSIAIALVGDPLVVFLDEPTVSLT